MTPAQRRRDQESGRQRLTRRIGVYPRVSKGPKRQDLRFKRRVTRSMLPSLNAKAEIDQCVSRQKLAAIDERPYSICCSGSQRGNLLGGDMRPKEIRS